MAKMRGIDRGIFSSVLAVCYLRVFLFSFSPQDYRPMLASSLGRQFHCLLKLVFTPVLAQSTHCI